MICEMRARHAAEPCQVGVVADLASMDGVFADYGM